MFCPRCGTKNDDNNYQCTKCALVLRPAPGPPPAGGDASLGGLIPYKNTCALIGYYLGVFSLIPCLGVLLGIPAFILGIIGLRHANEHPEANGKVHAWVGIILGGLVIVAHVASVVVLWRMSR